MEESLIKKVMPHSVEAEKSVIGAMFMDKDAIVTVSEILVGEEFYQKQYGVFFNAIVELYNEGKEVDVITLQDRLKEKDLPEEYVQIEFISGLVNSVPTTANVKNYANIVKEKAILRNLINVTQNIANECYLNKDGLEVILEETEKKIFNIVQNRSTNDYVPIKNIVLQSIESIEMVAKNKGTVTGVATGFLDLDYKTAGMQKSDLILIAARPSMGKTAFVLNLAEHMAVRDNVTTAIFSLEMSKEQLVKRMMAMNSRVDLQLMRSGNLKDDDWANLIQGANEIARSNLILDDTPSISVAELRSKCRKYKIEKNLGVIIIDYLQLIFSTF